MKRTPIHIADLDRVFERLAPYRLYIVALVHLSLFSLSYAFSFFMLRDLFDPEELYPLLARTVVLFVALRMSIFWYHDLFHGMWRYVSFPDLLNIIRSSAISSIVFVLAGALWEPVRVPERVLLLDLIFCIVLVGGTRFSVRKIRESAFPLEGRPGKQKDRILIVGPLNRAQALVKEMLSDPHRRYSPEAIVDPTSRPGHLTVRVSDLPVYSLDAALIRKERFHGLREVVVFWPEARRKELDTVVEALKPLQIPFRTLPHTDDILSGRINISDIRDVEIDDLLERPPVKTSMRQIREYIGDKTVLVTGGAGSIGSELCRQIAPFGPKLLVIVERSENTLYEFQLEMKRRFPSLPLYASISSINDFAGLASLMKGMKVDVVFHAAAYKHVPLMELASVESAYNNILGTYNVAQASILAGVRRFVMISTDKAVNPTNIMGVTKRIAEMVVQVHNGHLDTRFMVVRFGNVLGSAGSVIPIFKSQIARGGPVTVTHPEIERYFMTIPEAVQLILQAGCMGKGGEIYVLDMGKPVKILRLAEKLIALSGKRPHEDIEIAFTGLRPGEKMSEELFNQGEESLRTIHSQIWMAISRPPNRDSMVAAIEEIRNLVLRRDEKGLRRKFKELVPGYQSDEERSALAAGPASPSVTELPVLPERAAVG
jgi:FlaA1/EpsC-like NDP-sugar epimerase